MNAIPWVVAAVEHGKGLRKHAEENAHKGCPCGSCEFHRHQLRRQAVQQAARQRAQARKIMLESRKAKRAERKPR